MMSIFIANVHDVWDAGILLFWLIPIVGMYQFMKYEAARDKKRMEYCREQGTLVEKICLMRRYRKGEIPEELTWPEAVQYLRSQH